MIFLWTHRFEPSLRIRRVPLLLAGVLSLHLYGTISFLIYPVGSYISCTTEFWVMSIWLPFGIALFHAANSQFLHMASRQKQFARMSSLKDHKFINEEKAEAIANSRWRRVFAGLERADNINQTLTWIGVGMVVEVRLLRDSRFCSPVLITRSSSCLRSSSTLGPRSSILATEFSTTRSRAPEKKRALIVPKAGSGGFRSCGNCFGAGSMLLTCYGSPAASAMSTAGGYRLSAAALLGKLFHPSY